MPNLRLIGLLFWDGQKHGLSINVGRVKEALRAIARPEELDMTCAVEMTQEILDGLRRGTHRPVVSFVEVEDA